MSNTGGISEGNACDESTTKTTTSATVQQNTTSRSKWKWKCVSKECLTCLLLSAIVIGLPIAIIKILINLPKLSSRGDTRQQHYILLAFGFPFTLVFIVAVIYGSFRIVIRLQRGSNQSLRLRSSNISWRHLSRKRCHHLHQQQQQHISEMDSNADNRFYALVTQVMAQQVVFPETQFSATVHNQFADSELIDAKQCVNIDVNSDCDCDHTTRAIIGAHTLNTLSDTLHC